MQQQIEEYIGIWRDRLEKQEKYIDEVRSIKHDMEAHLLVLQYYLEEGKYEEAKIYLKQMKERQLNVFAIKEYDLGHSLVNAIVREQLEKAGEGIYFDWTGEIPDKIDVAEYDICTIFSNLMSNAVEACKKMSAYRKEIILQLCCKEGSFCIDMRNPVEGELDESLLGVGTTKEDKRSHGYGLRNIMEVVAKYDGNCEFRVENHIFIAQIVLPNIVEICDKE